MVKLESGFLLLPSCLNITFVIENYFFSDCFAAINFFPLSIAALTKSNTNNLMLLTGSHFCESDFCESDVLRH